MSESAVSHRLRSLEDTLTVALFHRSSEGVEPTNAGREFFARSQEALRVLDLAIADAAATSRGTAGRLKIGVYTSLSTGKLRDAFGEFSHDHPDTELELVEGSHSRMIEGFNARTIDVTVLIGPPEPLFGETLSLWREQVSAIVPETHPIASESEIGWAGQAGTGVVWLLGRSAPLELEAYNADALGVPIFSANAGTWPSSTRPLITPMQANGRVYAPAYKTVKVCGLVQ